MLGELKAEFILGTLVLNSVSMHLHLECLIKEHRTS